MAVDCTTLAECESLESIRLSILHTSRMEGKEEYKVEIESEYESISETEFEPESDFEFSPKFQCDCGCSCKYGHNCRSGCECKCGYELVFNIESDSPLELGECRTPKRFPWELLPR
jgi:hypothetical protein